MKKSKKKIKRFQRMIKINSLTDKELKKQSMKEKMQRRKNKKKLIEILKHPKIYVEYIMELPFKL